MPPSGRPAKGVCSQPVPVALVGKCSIPATQKVAHQPSGAFPPSQLGVGAVTSAALVEHALLDDLIGPNQ